MARVVLWLVSGLEGTVLLQLRADGRQDVQDASESLVQAAGRELSLALTQQDRGLALERAFKAQALLDAAQSEASALAASLRSALEQQQDAGIAEVLQRLERGRLLERRPPTASSAAALVEAASAASTTPAKAAVAAPLETAPLGGVRVGPGGTPPPSRPTPRPQTASATALVEAASAASTPHGAASLALAVAEADLRRQRARPLVANDLQVAAAAGAARAEILALAERADGGARADLLAAVRRLREKLRGAAGPAADLGEAAAALRSADPAQRLPAVALLEAAARALAGPSRQRVREVLADLDAGLARGSVPADAVARIDAVRRGL